MTDIKLPELPEKLNYLLDNLEHEVMKDRLDRMASVRLDIEDFVREYALSAIKAQSLQGVSDFGQLQSALEEIECLKSELSAVRENQQWQPIETAPKDGTAFLMCSGNWILTCHWHRFQHCWASCGPTYERLPSDEQPEYWMPLPSVPDSEGGK